MKLVHIVLLSSVPFFVQSCGLFNKKKSTESKAEREAAKANIGTAAAGLHLTVRNKLQPDTNQPEAKHALTVQVCGLKNELNHTGVHAEHAFKLGHCANPFPETVSIDDKERNFFINPEELKKMIISETGSIHFQLKDADQKTDIFYPCVAQNVNLLHEIKGQLDKPHFVTIEVTDTTPVNFKCSFADK